MLAFIQDPEVCIALMYSTSHVHVLTINNRDNLGEITVPTNSVRQQY